MLLLEPADPGSSVGRLRGRSEDVLDCGGRDGGVGGREQEVVVRGPGKPGAVQRDGAGDGDLADGVGEGVGGSGADGAEEGVPADGSTMGDRLRGLLR